MLQIADPGPRYEGFDAILPSGQRYRAKDFARLVAKVREQHPDVTERFLEADWCRRHPTQCLEVEEIPADAPARQIAYSKAVAPRRASGIRPVSAEAYEARLAVCQSCPHFRGEKGLGLISCKACGCTHMKAWAAREQCPDNPPRWRSLL